MVAASDVTGELTPDRLVLDAVRKWQPNLTDKRRLFAPFTTTLAEIRLAIEPDTDRPARTALSALAWHERAFVARFAGTIYAGLRQAGLPDVWDNNGPVEWIRCPDTEA